MPKSTKNLGSIACTVAAACGCLSAAAINAPAASAAAPCNGVNSYDEQIYEGGAPGAKVSYIKAEAKMDSCQVKEYAGTLDDRARAKNYLAVLAGLAPGYYKLITTIPATDAFIDSSEASELEKCSDGFTRGVSLELNNGRIHSCHAQ